jgi:hypothetical protein
VLGAEASNFLTLIGEHLIPVIIKAGHVFFDVTNFIMQNKWALGLLAGTVTLVMGTLIGVWAVNKAIAFGNAFKSATGAVQGLVSKLPGMGWAAKKQADESVAASEEQASASETSTATVQGANQTMADSAIATGEAFQRMAAMVDEAFGTMAATAATTATEVDASLATMRGGAMMTMGGGAGMAGGAGAMAAGGAAAGAGEGAAARGLFGTSIGAGLMGGRLLGTAVLGEGATAGGMALGAVAAPIAGYMAFRTMTGMLQRNTLGMGTAVNAIGGFFGRLTGAIGSTDPNLANLSPSARRYLETHGGWAGIHRQQMHQIHVQEAQALRQSTMVNRIAGVLTGQDVMPRDVKIVQSEGLGRDIGTMAGMQIGSILQRYLMETGGRVSAKDIAPLIGELHIHGGQLAANDIIRELSFAVRTGHITRHPAVHHGAPPAVTTSRTR